MSEKRKKRRANGANGRRRTNGTGTIERRGDKWLARWYVYDAHGNRFRKSKAIDADGIDEARRQLKELTEGDALITREKEIRRNLVQLEGVAAQRREWEDKQPALTIADAFDEYRNGGQWRETAERTAEDYERYFSDFAKWIAENRPERVELRDVTKEDAAAFAKDLREKTAAGTYNKRVVFLRRLWRVLMDCDKARLAVNPWEAVSKRNVIEHTRRELTAEELARVCAPLVGEMRVLFAVGVYTGLRLGDAALLDWGSVDLARRLISLIPSKTKRHAHGKPVLIPIHGTLAAILEETPTDKRTGRVMPEIASAYLHDSPRLSRRISEVFAAAGIETQSKADGKRAKTDVGFHSLRHTFVSLAANAGVPLAHVQSIVGHSNPAMTRHYFHQSMDALTNAVAALPDVTGTDTQQDDADAVAGRFRAFCALWEEMGETEREQAANWIADQRGKATQE